MAVILDGKAFAEEILAKLKFEIQALSKKPKLAVIIAGNDPASLIYVKNKRKKAEFTGIESAAINLPHDVTENDLLEHIYILNEDDNINGILVQLPLPGGINKQRIIEAIAPEKDADGFTSYNFGRLAAGFKPYAYPCTPKGIIKLLEQYNIPIEGANTAVIGRSDIAGKPAALMFLNKNASVSIAHSRTKDLKSLTLQADIIVSAAGKPGLITPDFIKEGAVLIDIGITRTPEGIKGDIDFNACFDKASYITPVPGGIGPMTIAMLMENTFELYKLQRSFKY